MSTDNAGVLAPRARRRPATRSRRGAGAMWYLVSGLIAAMFLFPLVMVALTAIKTPAEAASSPPTILPHDISLGNFRNLLHAGSGLWTYVGNSVLVALGTVVATVVLTTLAGYGLARFRFRLRSVVFVLLLAPMMVPFQALITPLYVVLFHMHLTNSLLGLTCIYVTSQIPFGIFVMRNAFAAVPGAVEEAAYVDGCGPATALFRVMLPLVAPGMATVALFAFFSAWNEFLAALVLLSDDSRLTLPVLLQNLTTGRFGALDWGMLEVGVVVTIVPCILIFLLLQRYYVEGLMAGSVK